MLYTVKEDLELCKEFKINPRQLMFIKILVKDPSMDEGEWRKKSYAMCSQFQQEIKSSAAEIADLIAREIIIDYNTPGSQIFYDCYEINPKFNHKFVLKVRPLSVELEEAYPNWLFLDGQKFLAHNACAEDIAPAYMKAIKKDPEEHKRVMEDLKWAISNGVLKIGLRKFVETKHWLAIRELRKEIGNSKEVSDVRVL